MLPDTGVELYGVLGRVVLFDWFVFTHRSAEQVIYKMSILLGVIETTEYTIHKDFDSFTQLLCNIVDLDLAGISSRT